MVEDDILTDRNRESDSIVKTVSNNPQGPPSNDTRNHVIINLPPIINQPVNFHPMNHIQESLEETNSGGNDSQSDESSGPLFFNYHEFAETYYTEVGSIQDGPKEHDKDHSLVVTHFPNIYYTLGSKEWTTTRIVRIPRAYHKRVNYPCFSEYLPGHEPAAIKDPIDLNTFICQGQIPKDGQWYGLSSISPLSLYFTPERFQEIVTTINGLIEKEYHFGGTSNVIDLSLGFLTLGVYTWLRGLFKGKIPPVDQYISELNNSQELTQCGVEIIPLTRSAYLSLDFQVPCPKPRD